MYHLISDVLFSSLWIHGWEAGKYMSSSKTALTLEVEAGAELPLLGARLRLNQPTKKMVQVPAQQ